MKTQYCLGFLFSLAGAYPQVVLIEKKRPEWQAGKLKGIGGKVEPGEYPGAAMRRECYEEAGIHVKEWTPFAELHYPECIVYVFAAQDNDKSSQIRSMTDEEVGLYCAYDTFNRIRNLTWLIPMALAKLSDALSLNVLSDRTATETYRIEVS